MEIETLSENNKQDQPIMIHGSKITVGDGVRFGFGFGFGMFLWAVIFSMLAIFMAGSFMSAMKIF